MENDHALLIEICKLLLNLAVVLCLVPLAYFTKKISEAIEEIKNRPKVEHHK